jgi:hypothetical protein
MNMRLMYLQCLNASYFADKLYRSIKDPHSALLCGHSTPNTVVFGEGMSQFQSTEYPLYFGYHRCMY